MPRVLASLSLTAFLALQATPSFSQQASRAISAQEQLFTQQQIFVTTLNAQENMVTLFGPAVNQMLLNQVFFQNYLAWFLGF
ncbi:MAG: hypothetical protein ACOZEN_15070 [Thermodesulfobacteriota bacterium]